MRVLHVAAGNSYGGIERMLVTMAGQRHAGLEQAFAVSFDGRLDRELRETGAVVERLPSPRASRPLTIVRARRAFVRAVEAVMPSAVVFHGAWPHAMFAAPARRLGMPIGFWQHQPAGRPAWPDWWARHVTPDFAVFNSRFTSARPAFPHTPGRVIRCPVPPPRSLDAATRGALRAEFGAGADDVVVFMAARLERWKGHDTLVRAAGMLTARHVRIWIAGGVQRAAEARYYRELAALAAAPGCAGRVTLLGEQGDVASLMALADVYCQPNLRPEPFGLSIAEAMCAGLPCVVSAPGGAAELIEHSSGVVTPPGDAAALASALSRLASCADTRRRMGASAADRARRLTNPSRRMRQFADLLAAQAS